MSKLRILLGMTHSELLHLIEIVQFHFDKQIHEFMRRAQIMTADETIDYILKHRCSVSRFGDGEFQTMEGGGNGFQHPDEKLKERLLQVFKSNDDKLLVCMDGCYKHANSGAHGIKVFYMRFMLRNKSVISWTDYNKIYGEAGFTRFYVHSTDKAHSKCIIEKIKKFWQNRDVYIVEGRLTRFGVGNNLLDNAKSVHRILGPSKSAFDKYDEILRTAENSIPKNSNTLVLLALGMTATVLAYDLSKLGYQAIDVGHLDVEYEWMLMGATKVVPIPTRFVNEANNYDEVVDCKDKNYLNQIIAKIV